jgi:peptidoglycan/LPS O-acetylase OafA/YrhL
MALAFPATLVCAVLSWYLVEKPGLAARHRLADALVRGRALVRRPH